MQTINLCAFFRSRAVGDCHGGLVADFSRHSGDRHSRRVFFERELEEERIASVRVNKFQFPARTLIDVLRGGDGHGGTGRVERERRFLARGIGVNEAGDFRLQEVAGAVEDRQGRLFADFLCLRVYLYVRAYVRLHNAALFQDERDGEYFALIVIRQFERPVRATIEGAVGLHGKVKPVHGKVVSGQKLHITASIALECNALDLRHSQRAATVVENHIDCGVDVLRWIQDGESGIGVGFVGIRIRIGADLLGDAPRQGQPHFAALSEIFPLVVVNLAGHMKAETVKVLVLHTGLCNIEIAVRRLVIAHLKQIPVTVDPSVHDRLANGRAALDDIGHRNRF